jgi:hypothetical protein
MISPSDKEEIITAITDAVVTRLGTKRASVVLPKSFTDELLKASYGYPYKYQFIMPIGSGGFITEYQLNSDGSIDWHIRGKNGSDIWSTVLVPGD